MVSVLFELRVVRIFARLLGDEPSETANCSKVIPTDWAVAVKDATATADGRAPVWPPGGVGNIPAC